ncbi:MAG: thiamine phosphate synthase [Verrucomicrobiae bacterium]|nr:thiamine phosphate synthase [Verrucomicrobiae bacterium]
MKKTTDFFERRQLYAILDTGYLAGRQPSVVAAEMIRGGVDIIQVRAKDLPEKEISALVREVLTVTRPAGVPLIVNDHPRIAGATGADGAHVGQDDISVAAARQMAGPGSLIGKSTHSLEQARKAVAEGADYIGVGPVFATPTKPDYTPVGLELVRQVSREITIPFFCIGGIKLENAPTVIAAGARRIVVVSGILQAPDLTAYCQALKKNLCLSS